jgi:hypothetical protein
MPKLKSNDPKLGGSDEVMKLKTLLRKSSRENFELSL